MSGLSKCIALFFLLGVCKYSQAIDSVNLMIMIEDADKDAIARDSRINKRVYASMAQQLAHIAEVYDETSVTLDTFNQTNIRRSDAELLDIARAITRPPIDVVLVFSTYASVHTTDYVKQARARVAGRLLNAKSGQFLDNFEVQSPSSWSIPYACNRQTCVLEAMGDEAKILGDELGVVLAKKLNWLLNGETSDISPDTSPLPKATLFNDYYLEFNGFSPEDMAHIEAYLLVFSGYVSHRPTQQRHTHTILLYRSTSASAMLSRNIHKLLEELDMRATVNFQGNAFKVKRITLRGKAPGRDVTDGW